MTDASGTTGVVIDGINAKVHTESICDTDGSNCKFVADLQTGTVWNSIWNEDWGDITYTWWNIHISGDIHGTNKDSFAIFADTENTNGWLLRLFSTWHASHPWSIRLQSTASWNIDFYRYDGGSTFSMRITSGGDLGIWTETPEAKLDVYGDGNFNWSVEATSFSGDGSNLTNLPVTNESLWNTWASDSINYIAGNVGIGTDIPDSKLHLRWNSPFIEIWNTEETEAGIIFRDSVSTHQSVQIIHDTSSGHLENKLKFKMADWITKMTLLDNGNLGIWTETPTTKLDVNGTGKFNNIISEWFIQVGNSTTCSDSDDAGKLRFNGACSWVGQRTETLYLCMGNGLFSSPIYNRIIIKENIETNVMCA